MDVFHLTLLLNSFWKGLLYVYEHGERFLLNKLFFCHPFTLMLILVDFVDTVGLLVSIISSIQAIWKIKHERKTWNVTLSYIIKQHFDLLSSFTDVLYHCAHTGSTGSSCCPGSVVCLPNNISLFKSCIIAEAVIIHCMLSGAIAVLAARCVRCNKAMNLEQEKECTNK